MFFFQKNSSNLGPQRPNTASNTVEIFLAVPLKDGLDLEKKDSVRTVIPYTSYRNTAEDLQLLQQKFDYCTTAGNLRLLFMIH